MNEQITIIAMIDIRAALDAKTLKENIYMIDCYRRKGSEGSGTGDLTTIIKGGYWIDGSQSCEFVINWFAGGLNSLPSTLPRNYAAMRAEQIDKEHMHSLKNFHLSDNSDRLNAANDIGNAIKNLGEFDCIEDENGVTAELDIKPLNRIGNLYNDGESIDNLSFLPPIITDITGEAVERGVIFPAQYGTPVSLKDGWYWSATVDTCKTGIFSYTIHFILFTRKGNSWIPVEMTHEAKIKVMNAPQKNGFTNAGLGFLPVVD